MNIRLLDWNVNFRSAKTLDAFVRDDCPVFDLLTLQEVKNSYAEEYIARLNAFGFQAIHTGDSLNGKKTYGNLVASRWPIKRRALELSNPPPFPSLIGHASVAILPNKSLDILTVHAPNGSGNGWDKIYTLEALKCILETLAPGPVIVTGDYNEPQFFPGIVPVRSWAWTSEKTWAIRKDELWGRKNDQHRTEKHPLKRWDNAVGWFFDENAGHSLRHAFWVKNGVGSMEPSYVTRSACKSERWFDHAFVSPHFEVIKCEYRHDVRRPGGESDHSALCIELAL